MWFVLCSVQASVCYVSSVYLSTVLCLRFVSKTFEICVQNMLVVVCYFLFTFLFSLPWLFLAREWMWVDLYWEKNAKLMLSLSLWSQRSNHGRLWGLWGCNFFRLQRLHPSIWKNRRRQIWSQYPSKNKSKLVVLKLWLLPSTPYVHPCPPYVHPCPCLPPCLWTSRILPMLEMDPRDRGMCYIVWVSVFLFFFMRRFSIISACFSASWTGTKWIFSQWTVVVRALQQN